MKTTTTLCALILAWSPLVSAMNLQVRDGRPIVDGVYVNGHGPYRFLVDTGSNINLIDTKLAQAIGLETTMQAELASATGKTTAAVSDGNEITLGPVKAGKQEIVFSRLEGLRDLSSDIQGVLGQWFLSRFDYLIDLKAKHLEFGKQDRNGTRMQFKIINARAAISTSLGTLVLDSGAARLALFALKPDSGRSSKFEFRTAAGSQEIGMVAIKPLVIGGRTVARGDAVAIPTRTEPEVNGLLPLRLFKSIYFCNSEGYIVLD